MLALWDPFNPVSYKSDSKISTKSYFDRLFENTFDTAFHDLYRIPVGMGIEYKKDEAGALMVSIDLPGVQEQDINVEVVDNILTIKGEKKTATSTCSVQKSISIPEGYDTNDITAELKNGVLGLKINNKPLPSKEVKKIPILTAK